MGLRKYRDMRDFETTPEPAGEVTKSATGRSFVVQKHGARRLHYDFRLELDGVLLSWAVPKGPSLDPDDKRLAVHTEDHPIEYGGFEGVIPKGEYGAGNVVVWDHGTWEPIGDAQAGHRKGKLRFRLFGEKLRGEWLLVRTGGGDDEKETWMLRKLADGEADPARDITAEQPQSVVTGRTLDEVGRDRDRIWNRQGEQPVRRPEQDLPDPSKLPGARRAALPDTITPELATLAKTAPEGDDWVHEIKYDGYRALGSVQGGRATMISRNGKDWTRPFAPLAAALGALPVADAWFDGEVVVMASDGTTDFQTLQNDLGSGRSDRLLYYVFDLLYLDGWDLRKVPLLERKRALKQLLEAGPSGPLRYSDHVVGHGPLFFQNACRMALEGVIAKRAESVYRGARTTDWLKVKCVCRDEFVIGGYTEPQGARTGFGAMLVGIYDDEGRFWYVGRVGTGFSERTLVDLTGRMRALEQPSAPFDNEVPRAHARRAHWIRPELVATVEYSELTRDGILRHASFEGLREDVEPRQVVRKQRPGAGPAPEQRKEAAPKSATRYRARSGEQVAVVAGVDLTNPDRRLYGEIGVTKLELAQYYERYADRVLPQMTDRPLSLLRCPDGIDANSKRGCFYQKHVKGALPEGMGRVLIDEKEGRAPYFYIEDLRGLIGLVQMGVLEVHPWGSRVDRPDRPDRLIFDLDPDVALPFEQVVQGVLDVKEVLDELGLVSFCKTTGGKGYHIVVPIGRRSDWDEARAFTAAVAERVASRHRDRYTTNMAKSRRHGRIFIDYLRNGYGATAVAAWSTRARPGAPIATPIGWDELPSVRPDHFGLRNVDRRLEAMQDDPWAAFEDVRQSITASIRRALGLA